MSHPNTTRSLLLYLLRMALWLVTFLIAIIVIIPIGTILFFDPNDYKKEMSTYLTQASGFELEIKGNIELKFFPWLGLKAKHVILAQPPSFGHGAFIDIHELGFKMPIYELLHRHFIIDKLMITGININVLKLADGTTNFSFFSKKPNVPLYEQKTEKHTQNAFKAPRLIFDLHSFEVHNAQFHYEDQKANQDFTAQLHAKGDRGQDNSYPITGEFSVHLDPQATSTLDANAQFHGTLFLQPTPTLKVNTTISLQFPEYNLEWQKIKLSTFIDADLTKGITVSDLDLQAKTTHITGDAYIPIDVKTPIHFNARINQLHTDNLPIKGFFQNATDISQQATTSSKKTSTKTSSSLGTTQPTRSMIGDIFIQDLFSKGITLSKVHLHLKKEQNILKATSVTADFYEGKLTAEASTDLHNPHSGLLLQGNIHNLSVAPLLQDVQQTSRLSGRADIDFTLAQSAHTPINGTIALLLKKGELQGIDVKHYLSRAMALFKKDQVLHPDIQKTAFDELKGTFDLHDNLLDNNDLVISASDFKANGEGRINLNNQAINYKLKAWQHDDPSTHPHAYPLAIRIKGTLRHPKVEPDLDLYLKMLLKQEISKQVGKHILEKIMPPSQEGAQDSVSSPEVELKKKLEKKLEKGLKKIFK